MNRETVANTGATMPTTFEAIQDTRKDFNEKYPPEKIVARVEVSMGFLRHFLAEIERRDNARITNVPICEMPGIPAGKWRAVNADGEVLVEGYVNAAVARLMEWKPPSIFLFGGKWPDVWPVKVDQ